MPCQSKFTVCKEMKFEAAHRLVHGYPNKCKNNHGHSWVVFVTVGLKPHTKLDRYGFVKDYGDFKPLKQWIDDNLDHATLVSDSDTSLIKWLQDNMQRHFIVPHNPTSELIAQVIYRKACELLPDACCEVLEVRIKETCTSEAVYSEAQCHCEK